MSAGAPLQGPRCARSDELESIIKLADCVFMPGRTAVMADLFPRLFHQDNLENLFVFVEDGRVVSHVGMVERKARIAGCGLHVACMGAVATYEEFRGRGLASQLVHAALDKARADGVDVMLISGDRTLYRRIGAFPVGRDCRCVVDADVLDRLHNPSFQVRKALESDLAACAAAYDAKPVGFVRPMEEWTDYIDSKAAAEGWHHLLVVEEAGVFRGYVAVHRGLAWGYGEVAEFGEACGTAGDDFRSARPCGGRGAVKRPRSLSCPPQGLPYTPATRAGATARGQHFLCGSLRSVCKVTGETSLRITLQGHDTALRECLADAGASFSTVSVDGAWAIVSFTRLMDCLRPWIEQRVGSEVARSMKCSEDEATCTLSMLGETLTLSRAEAVQMVFGTPEGILPSTPFCRVFPIPTLPYGIGYV